MAAKSTPPTLAIVEIPTTSPTPSITKVVNSDSKKKKKKKGPPSTNSYNERKNLEMLAFARKLGELRSKVGESPLGQNGIPFKWASFFKGTQAPTIRLYQMRGDVGDTNATANNFVLSIQASIFTNFSDLANVFDEYRPIRGEIFFHCSYTGVAANPQQTRPTVGVVDYDDATALASFDAGLSYDTKRIFDRVCFPHQAKSEDVSWPIKFDWVPDMEWLTTSTTNTAFATLKLYTNSTDVGSTVTSTGFFYGWVEFQFRGLD